MFPAPASFDGEISQFFRIYSFRNIPPIGRLREFDRRLRSYLARPESVHPTRVVNGQVRGEVCKTSNGLNVLPTDNSPVWWIHRFLLSDEAFPEDDAQLFETLPCHIFKLPKDQPYLNAMGYHAAHLFNAKNGDTNWEAWSNDELRRRALLNIHPCNMFLIAKCDWQLWGGRQDVLEWVSCQYHELFGDLMKSFLADIGAENSSPICARDLVYRYRKLPREIEEAVSRQKGKAAKADVVLPLNRPMIQKSLLESETLLKISTSKTTFVVPHD